MDRAIIMLHFLANEGFLMPAPLLSLTQKPLPSNPFVVGYHVGGDDTQRGRSGLMGRIAEWDLDADKSCFTANFLFVFKKLFNFLDVIGTGACWYGKNGSFNKAIEESKYYQTGLIRNRHAREQIVAALGGENACRAFRAVDLTPSQYNNYWSSGDFSVRDECFSRGESIVQGETPAGTKFAAMRLTERTTGQVFIATMHQLCRETCIRPSSSDGSVWTLNFFPFLPGSRITNILAYNTEDAASFTCKVREGRDARFVLTPKP